MTVYSLTVEPKSDSADYEEYIFSTCNKLDDFIVNNFKDEKFYFIGKEYYDEVTGLFSQHLDSENYLFWIEEVEVDKEVIK